MTKNKYLKLLNYFSNHPFSKHLILTLGSLCPIIIFSSYGALLLILVFRKDAWIIQATLIPACCFFLTTIIRKWLNWPRPFEIYQFEPLKYHDKGESFPSRHSASAMIISLTCLHYNPIWGICLLFVTMIIGLSRIFMAVHFIRDVLSGFLLALLCSLIYFI